MSDMGVLRRAIYRCVPVVWDEDRPGTFVLSDGTDVAGARTAAGGAVRAGAGAVAGLSF
jgi:hypothetical protein